MPPVLGLLALCLNAGCAATGGRIELSAGPGLRARLAEILEASPLPKAWVPTEADGEATLSLVATPADPAQQPGAHETGGPLSADAGLLWLAPALPISSPLYRLDSAQARAAGLEALDEILPPRRAASVDGRWPGQPGYPFVERLELRLSSRRRIPPVLASWLAGAAAAAKAEPAPIVLGAAGDLQVGPRSGLSLIGGEAGLERVFAGGLLPLMRSRDLLVANLEGPITARGSPNPRKRFHFRFPPGSAKALGDAGFSLLLFANNHGFDFGEEGFLDTLEDLEGAAMPFVGAGRNEEEAGQPRVLAALPGGQRLSFVGFASYPTERLGFTTAEALAGAAKPGIAGDPRSTLDAIRIAAAAGDTVIVLAHGGREYVESPTAETRELYRGFADAGARLVIGSHPHVLQGLEARGSSLIAYSLGNFLFTEELEPPQAVGSALLSFLLYRGIPRGFLPEPVSAGIDGSRLEHGEAARLGVERLLSRLSSGLEAGP
ncbi:MAG TPA: CapA family protein [Rectinemataceae bacterium]|nr:CapA family protein [Rectinemataceae bacterium]